MRVRDFTVAIVFACCSLCKATPCPDKIRVAISDGDSRPFLNGHGPALQADPGLIVSRTRAALKVMGCLGQAEFLRVPPARISILATSNPSLIDIVPAVPITASVARHLILPPEADEVVGTMGMMSVDFALVSYPARAKAWDGRDLHLLPGDTVGVVRDSAMQAYANKRGWPTEIAGTFDSAWNKFLMGRSSFLLAAAPAADARIAADPGPVRLQPAAVHLHLFVGTSPAFYAKHREFVQRLWTTACELENAVSSTQRICKASQS